MIWFKSKVSFPITCILFFFLTYLKVFNSLAYFLFFCFPTFFDDFCLLFDILWRKFLLAFSHGIKILSIYYIILSLKKMFFFSFFKIQQLDKILNNLEKVHRSTIKNTQVNTRLIATCVCNFSSK